MVTMPSSFERAASKLVLTGNHGSIRGSWAMAICGAEKCPEAQLLRTHRGGFADGVGFRPDHWESGTVSVWQADRELSGTGTVGGFQRRSAPAGTYQQARQRAAAFPAGGSGASDGAQPSGMA